MIWGQNVASNETESHTNSSVIHESWEFDSGTHDLEIDTISLHKQIEASGIEMPSNINELLDLANKASLPTNQCCLTFLLKIFFSSKFSLNTVLHRFH
jgi:hypothetical protein